MAKKKTAAEHLALLGTEVRDRITGWEGIVITIAFDLFGCVQAVVKPKVKADGTLADGQWFDTSRLEVLNSEPAMPVPSFAEGFKEPGGSEKPRHRAV